MLFENPLYAQVIHEVFGIVEVECRECRRVYASWDAGDFTMLEAAVAIERHIRHPEGRHRSRHDSESIWRDVWWAYRLYKERKATGAGDPQRSLFDATFIKTEPPRRK